MKFNFQQWKNLKWKDLDLNTRLATVALMFGFGIYYPDLCPLVGILSYTILKA